MSIEVQGNIQQPEQYVIRAKRDVQSASQVQETESAVQNATKAAEVDTYDKDNPAGVQAEGVYSVSHDESGNLKVDYMPKSETSKTQSAPKIESSAAASTASSTSSDDELEQLEQQKARIQQQLSRETDENVKAQLRTQLQAVEAQIIQLKTN